MDIIVKVLPIIREADGLAMSSRNEYLNEKEKESAAILYQALKKAEGLFSVGERNAKKIIDSIRGLIKTVDTAKIDYIKIVDTNSLEDIDEIKNEALIALAVSIGKTRLIDNIIVGAQNDQA